MEINADLASLAIAHTARMDWTESPGGEVLRKRVYLEGSREKGAVTSVVRYPVGSQFPRHEHPDGEEIFVLEGVFEDEHGRFPAGSYILNPPGSAHAPRSPQGCTLFVRLRQYRGSDRATHRIDTNTAAWIPHPEHQGVERIALFEDEDYPEVVRLVRFAPGISLPSIPFPAGEEIFVIEGSFRDEHGDYEQGSWVRYPAGSAHSPQSEQGCTLLVKKGHLTS